MEDEQHWSTAKMPANEPQLETREGLRLYINDVHLPSGSPQSSEAIDKVEAGIFMPVKGLLNGYADRCEACLLAHVCDA